jgi:hypothetical protein
MRILEGMAGLVVERQHAGGKGFFCLGKRFGGGIIKVPAGV